MSSTFAISPQTMVTSKKEIQEMTGNKSKRNESKTKKQTIETSSFWKCLRGKIYKFSTDRDEEDRNSQSSESYMVKSPLQFPVEKNSPILTRKQSEKKIRKNKGNSQKSAKNTSILSDSSLPDPFWKNTTSALMNGPVVATPKAWIF